MNALDEVGFAPSDHDISACATNASRLTHIAGPRRPTSIAATLAGLTPTVTLAQAFDANSRRTQLSTTIGTTADFKNDYTFDALNRTGKGVRNEWHCRLWRLDLRRHGGQ